MSAAVTKVKENVNKHVGEMKRWMVERFVSNPPQVCKEQSLLFNFQHMTQVVEEGLNKVAFRELDTLNQIFTTTSLIFWEANNNNSIAVGGSAGLSQDSVAIMMFTVMDT